MTHGAASSRRCRVGRSVAAGLALALAGCDARVELFRSSDVQAANEIQAALRHRGIDVERTGGKDDVVLSVTDADFYGAAGALRDAGLPRQPRRGLADAFTGKGLLPSPLEERTRYVHALEAALESVILDIDGVVSVRARVVPPERPSPGAPLVPASASLLIKHRPDIDLTGLLPGLVRLVKNGVPGLAGEDDRHVAVMLVKEREPAAAAVRTGPGAVVRQSYTAWAAAAALGTAGTAMLGWHLRRWVTRLRAAKR